MSHRRIKRSIMASLLLIGTSTLYATDPAGNGTAPKLWLKANTAVTGTTDVTAWGTLTNDATADRTPSLLENNMNFNPVIHFDNSANTLYDANLSFGSITKANIFYVAKNGAGSNAQIIAFNKVGYTGGNKYDSPSISKDGVWSKRSNGDESSRIFGTTATTTPYFREVEIDDTNLTLYHYNSVDDEYEYNANILGTDNMKGVALGSDKADGGNNSGVELVDIAEVIVYDALNTDSNRLRIQSYLAIKYGMTLDTTNNDYVMSSGAPVWTHANNLYPHHIIGIARDDATSLNQEITKSIGTGAILTVSSDNNFTGANGTHTDLADGDYLLVGNDNNVTTTQTTDIETNLYTERVSRIWRMEKRVGSLTTVNLKFDGFDDSWDLIRTSGFGNSFISNPTTVATLNANGEALNVPIINGMRFTLAKANILFKIGHDADSDPATDTNPRAAQLNDITGVGGAVVANEGAYQIYINTYPDEVQIMINRVNLLVNIGTDADGGTDVTPTAAELNALPNVTGAITTNEGKYQIYINTHPDEFSAPATEAEVQAMITTVNNQNIVLPTPVRTYVPTYVPTPVIVPEEEPKSPVEVTTNDKGEIELITSIATTTKAKFTGIEFVKDEEFKGDGFRGVHQEVQNDIKDATFGDGCNSDAVIEYTVYVTVNTDNTINSGYRRTSDACAIPAEDETVTPAFGVGTQTEVREASSEEQERFGNSHLVIVSDVPLDNDITLGGI